MDKILDDYLCEYRKEENKKKSIYVLPSQSPIDIKNLGYHFLTPNLNTRAASISVN